MTALSNYDNSTEFGELDYFRRLPPTGKHASYVMRRGSTVLCERTEGDRYLHVFATAERAQSWVESLHIHSGIGILTPEPAGLIGSIDLLTKYRDLRPDDIIRRGDQGYSGGSQTAVHSNRRTGFAEEIELERLARDLFVAAGR